MENKHIVCSNKIRNREKLMIKNFALKDIIRNVCIMFMRVLHECV